jgi:predicted nucleic acid-binding protein
MIAYVDSSVVLRLILGQRDALAEWPQVERGVASELVEIECLRTIDRLWLAGEVTAESSVALREAIYRLTGTLEVVGLTRPVLARASQPLPTPLGTLDALHLSTALLCAETLDLDLVMLTHDRTLARAAVASGLESLGS